MEEDVRPGKRISAKRIILTSFLVDVLNVFISFIVAVLSGSVIVFAQFLEEFSDLVSSGLLLIGITRSLRKEDKTHPFGYGREIYFWTFLAAIIMFGITSTLSFYIGFRRFMAPSVVQNVNIVFFAVIVSLVTNAYSFILGYRRLMSSRGFFNILKVFYRSSLVETKTVFTLDLMGSFVSFLGLLALLVYRFTGDMRFDGIGAVGMSLVLAVISVFLMFGIKDMLIGRSASLETEEKIKKATLGIDKVEAIRDLKTLHLGSEKLLVSLDVEIKEKLKVKQIEKIIGAIELKIKRVVPSAKYVMVEFED